MISIYIGLYGWFENNYWFIALAAANLINVPGLLALVRRNYKNEITPAGECIIEFKDGEIFCKHKGSTLWHVPINQVSHIENQYRGTGKWFIPKIKDTYIFTNNKDSYIFPHSINETDLANVQRKIESEKIEKVVFKSIAPH